MGATANARAVAPASFSGPCRQGRLAWKQDRQRIFRPGVGWNGTWDGWPQLSQTMSNI